MYQEFQFKQLKDFHPTKSIGDPSDLLRAVMFLLDPTILLTLDSFELLKQDPALSYLQPYLHLFF